MFSSPIVHIITGILILLPSLTFQINNFNNTLRPASTISSLNDSEEEGCSTYKIRKIVIDAGHGGKDHGCSGKHSSEKKITLKIAKKLGASIEKQFPDVEVIYTRKTDVFVPLHERASIANEANADLFISIHCNAMSKADHIHGSETYVMGLSTAEENLETAKRENAAILMEADYQQNYDGYDPNSPEGHIILSMFQHAFLEQSILFAEKVEYNFKYKLKRKSLGVKQAGFVVLRATAMPSVLIESGYLSNSNDENFLKQDKGQNAIANSILSAFTTYKHEMEHREETDDRVVAAPIQINHTSNTSKQVRFKVQLAASKSKIDTSQKLWRQIQDLEILQEGGMYKYLCAGNHDYSVTLEKQRFFRKNGFDSAFVVAYVDQKRVKIEEALNLLGQ